MSTKHHHHHHSHKSLNLQNLELGDECRQGDRKVYDNIMESCGGDKKCSQKLLQNCDYEAKEMMTAVSKIAGFDQMLNLELAQPQNLQLRPVTSFGAFEWILVLFWIAFGVVCGLEVYRPYKKQPSNKKTDGIEYNAINHDGLEQNML